MSYQCILADPPWPHIGGGGRGAQEHYPVLRVPEIIRVMLTAPCWRPRGNGCHLWLWCPNNWLPRGLMVVAALGFRFVTKHVWVKDRYGIGHYGRGQDEPLLLGVMGRLPPLVGARRVGTVIGGRPLPRREHSRKPDEQYAHIETISPGPRLEMFARNRRAGWDAWGNEV